MKFCRVFAILLLCFFSVYTVSYAAIGGSKIKMSAPKTTQKAPVNKTQPQKDGYKESAPANSYSDKAPAANSKAQSSAVNSAATKSASPFGGMMRNIGIFAGGMMLGSMLGSMFGMNGFMSDIMGLMLNVLIFGGVILLGKTLWDKFKSRKNEDENVYNRCLLYTSDAADE